jgi:hypothetical protein
MNRAILITADNICGYCPRPFQSSSLTSSTANAHTNGLPYSLRVIPPMANEHQRLLYVISVTVFEEDGDCIVCLEMRADELMRHLIPGELADYKIVRTNSDPLQSSLKSLIAFELQRMFLQQLRLKMLAINPGMYATVLGVIEAVSLPLLTSRVTSLQASTRCELQSTCTLFWEEGSLTCFQLAPVLLQLCTVEPGSRIHRSRSDRSCNEDAAFDCKGCIK